MGECGRRTSLCFAKIFNLCETAMCFGKKIFIFFTAPGQFDIDS
jgi:hypothetical protein